MSTRRQTTRTGQWKPVDGYLEDRRTHLRVLERRCCDAGLDPIPPHQFRHTMAHRWLAAGRREAELMRLTGWRFGEIVGCFAASAADERAREATAARPSETNSRSSGSVITRLRGFGRGDALK